MRTPPNWKRAFIKYCYIAEQAVMYLLLNTQGLLGRFWITYTRV